MRSISTSHTLLVRVFTRLFPRVLARSTTIRGSSLCVNEHGRKRDACGSIRAGELREHLRNKQPVLPPGQGLKTSIRSTSSATITANALRGVAGVFAFFYGTHAGILAAPLPPDIVWKSNAHSNFVNGVSISPDGSLFASGSGDKTIRLWRLADGTPLHTLTGHSDIVNAVAFSPDGTLLASGSGDQTVKLWRVSDGMLLRTFFGHSEFISSVAFSPDGSALVSASGDTSLRLWRVNEGGLLRVF